MRIVIIFLLLMNAYPVMAITRCEVDGKVTYKTGRCPEDATAKYLVRGKYVEEKVLQKQARERIESSERAFNQKERLEKQRSERVLRDFVEQEEAERVQMSNESVHFQLQKADPVNNKTEKKGLSGTPRDVDEKLLEMERRVEKHQQALEQLQQQ